MPTNPTRQIALAQNNSILIAAPNKARKFIAFAQIDANTILYVSNVQSDNNQGFPVMPRSYIGFECTADKIDVTAPWYCYTTGAAQVINVIEGYFEGPTVKQAITIPVRGWR